MNVSVVAAVNRPEVLQQNLLASPMLAEGGVPLLIEEGHASASIAYNAGLRRTDADIVVFAHQDVYIPRGWDERLREAVESLGDSWGALGVFGVTRDSQYRGQVWSTGLARELDMRVSEPEQVVSLDELALVLRRDSGLMFDEDLPGFHMYGTDIVQTARARNLGAYVFQGPVIHNSLPVRKLDRLFWRAHRYVRRKWWHQLPIPTCTVDVTWRRHDRLREAVRAWRGRLRTGATEPRRLEDPVQKARELGYE